MALRWDVRRAVAEDAGRAARREVVAAARVLRAASRSPAGTPVPAASKALATAVHEARKSLKRARTVLRLVRDAVGRSRFRAAKDRLSSAAGQLSGLRDAKVVLDALDRLLGDSSVDAETVSGLRRQLVEEHAQEHRRAADEVGPRAEAIERIAAGRADAARWPLVGEDFREVVESAVRRFYRRGRRRMDEAREELSSAALHAWRKRVKDLGYSVELMAGSWTEVLDPLAAEIRRLWELLGQEHDLMLLLETAERRREAFASPDDADTLRDVIEARRRQLRTEAFDLGRRIYVESPKRFAHRLCSYR